jgi:hypothetical protein
MIGTILDMTMDFLERGVSITMVMRMNMKDKKV